MPVPSSASTNSPGTTRQPSPPVGPGGGAGRRRGARSAARPDRGRPPGGRRRHPRRRPGPPGRRPRWPHRPPRSRGRARRRPRCWTAGSTAWWSRPPGPGRPGCRGRARPAAGPAASPSSSQREQHVGRLVDDVAVDVGLAQLVAAQCGAAPGAVRDHLDVLVEEPLVPEVLEVPPHRLDVLGGEGPVGAVDVDPVADPLGQGLPLVDVVAHRLAAEPGELGDADLLLDLSLGR